LSGSGSSGSSGERGIVDMVLSSKDSRLYLGVATAVPDVRL